MTAPPPADPSALESLLQHEDFIRRLARSLLVDEHAAEDVAQETWLAAIRRPPALLAGTQAWLSTVARNFAYQSVRAKVRRVERERRASRGEAADSAPDPLVSESTRRGIKLAVLCLREPYQSTVLMRFWEGLTPAAIAARTSVSVDTVKTRLRRGIAKLRSRLDRKAAPE